MYIAPPFLPAVLSLIVEFEREKSINEATAPPSIAAWLPENSEFDILRELRPSFIESLRTATAPPTVLDIFLLKVEFEICTFAALPMKIAPPPPSSVVVNLSAQFVDSVEFPSKSTLSIELAIELLFPSHKAPPS